MPPTSAAVPSCAAIPTITVASNVIALPREDQEDLSRSKPLIPRESTRSQKPLMAPPPRAGKAMHGRHPSQRTLPHQERLAAIPLSAGGPTGTSGSYQGGVGHPARRRRGVPIQITVRNRSPQNLAHNDVFPARNTWPKNDTTTRARRGANPPARAPLSIFGDALPHSFIVCGAPGCRVCSYDTDNTACFLRGGPSSDSGRAIEKPGRSLIQHACEHCRMPFIPKQQPMSPRNKEALSAYGRLDDRCDDEEACVASDETTSADDSMFPDSFCSGECKMSYMLTNPTAMRRQRAAAAAKAAARAVYVEGVQRRDERQPQISKRGEGRAVPAVETDTTRGARE